MGEVVPRRPYIPHPLPLCINCHELIDYLLPELFGTAYLYECSGASLRFLRRVICCSRIHYNESVVCNDSAP